MCGRAFLCSALHDPNGRRTISRSAPGNTAGRSTAGRSTAGRDTGDVPRTGAARRSRLGQHRRPIRPLLLARPHRPRRELPRQRPADDSHQALSGRITAHRQHHRLRLRLARRRLRTQRLARPQTRRGRQTLHPGTHPRRKRFRRIPHPSLPHGGELGRSGSRNRSQLPPQQPRTGTRHSPCPGAERHQEVAAATN